MENQTELIEAFNKDLRLILTEKAKCKFIKGHYYIMNESCILMGDDQWYRINTGKILFDDAQQSWVKVGETALMLFLKAENGLLKIAHTSSRRSFIDSNGSTSLLNLSINPSNNGDIYHEWEKYIDWEDLTYLINNIDVSTSNIIIKQDVIDKLQLIRLPLNHTFILPIKNESILNSLMVKPSSNINSGLNYSYPLQYNLENNHSLDGTMDAYDNNYLSLQEEAPSKYKQDYSKYFKGLSYGVEIETQAGKIPEEELKKNGFIALRDGSLGGGYEYTSIPFYDSVGLYAIEKIYTQLQKYCTISKDCSFHIHFGGYPRTKLYLLALYRLSQRVQEEMFSIVPPYKKHYSYWVEKARPKDHCQSLINLNIDYKKALSSKKDLTEQFSNFYAFVSEGFKEGGEINFETGRHPRGVQNKWNYSARYYWINFLPIMFTGKTIEIRLWHSPLDFEEVYNQILISNALLQYTINNVEKILNNEDKILLEDILIHTYDLEISQSLVKFCNLKRNQYYLDSISKNYYAEINRQNSKFSPSGQFVFNESVIQTIDEEPTDEEWHEYEESDF